MLEYVLRRIAVMFLVLVAVSVCAFAIIQLPPGDFLTDYIAALQMRGTSVDQAEVEALRHQYGLDRPIYAQYLRWMSKIVRGDMGWSFSYRRPVSDLLQERLPMTILISVLSLLFVYVVAVPIGIYSATRQYSLFDYGFTFTGFIGLATPNFLLALVLMFVAAKYLSTSVGGLLSPEFESAAFSLGKLWDFFKHVWVPIVVVGTAGTASLIRILRANLLDELKKPYVEMQRAKGVPEGRLIIRYPLRVAVNPFISSIGWILPQFVSGTVITAVVLNLPTAGPLFLQAVRAQDMPLAGAFIMLTGFLTIIGMLASDIVLAIVDPRIRYG
jgi:peptide/nickel transport system permease protein